jgi:hypothetical protein
MGLFDGEGQQEVLRAIPLEDIKDILRIDKVVAAPKGIDLD